MHHLRIGLLLALGLGLASALGLQGADVEKITLMLDWLPNPNHVPFYVAQIEGFFSGEGLEVELLVPGNPADPAKLAAAGRVELAITTGMNLIVARDAGLPLTAIAALIQHPLGGLLVLRGRGISRLEDLRGRRIGYALEPEEPILWRAMLGCVGVEPGEYELINVGFNTVSALLSGAVEAIGAFRNYEKILVELQGKETAFFPMEEYCIPDNYELVFVASEAAIAGRPGVLRGFVAALARAVEFTLRDPNRALDDFFSANPELRELDYELNLRSFLATILYFGGSPCVDDPERWGPLQDFLFAQGLIAQEAALEELFTAELLPADCAAD